MRWIHCFIVVLLMLIPFVAIKSEDFATYVYWVAVTLIFLIYTAFDTRRWENE